MRFESLIDSVGRPIELQQRTLHISASVGIVVHPDDGQPDRLVAHADAAMYAAKRAGGSTWAIAGVAREVANRADARIDCRIGLIAPLLG